MAPSLLISNLHLLDSPLRTRCHHQFLTTHRTEHPTPPHHTPVDMRHTTRPTAHRHLTFPHEYRHQEYRIHTISDPRCARTRHSRRHRRHRLRRSLLPPPRHRHSTHSLRRHHHRRQNNPPLTHAHAMLPVPAPMLPVPSPAASPPSASRFSSSVLSSPSRLPLSALLCPLLPPLSPSPSRSAGYNPPLASLCLQLALLPLSISPSLASAVVFGGLQPAAPLSLPSAPLSLPFFPLFCPLSGAISFFVVLPLFLLRQLSSLFVSFLLIISFSASYPPTHREHPFFFLLLLIPLVNLIHLINPIFCKYLFLETPPYSQSVALKLPICRITPPFTYQSVAATLPICRTVLLICRRYLTNLSLVNLLSPSPSTTYSPLNKF